MTPLLGKIYEINSVNPIHRKRIYEIDCEHLGFRGKRPPQNPGDAPE
jgi:hypothetical protein